MIKEKSAQGAPRYVAVVLMMALATVALLMTACSSGQASSSASNSSAAAASSASAADKSPESATSQSRPVIDRSGFAGTWNLVDMEKDGARVSEMNPSAVDAMREENFLNIAEDGFVDFVQDGQVVQSVWEASSSTEGKMAYGSSRNDAIPMVINDGKLVFGPIDGVMMYFEKGEPRETPPLAEGQPNLREILGG